MPSTLLLFALLTLGVHADTTTSYTNPVLTGDTPDPGVIFDASLHQWVVATTGCDAVGCFALHTSPNLVDWTAAGYIFPLASLPTWASSGITYWAPEIHTPPSGGFVAYFVSRNGLLDKSNGPLCIGVAQSSGNALGPYKATEAPLVVNPPGECWGVIDPTFYMEGDNAYLVFKSDGNFCGKVTTIFSTPLTKDGLNTTGAPWVALITNTDPWEGPLVEAPWVVRNGTYLYLFFSGSVYNQPSYSIGVARAKTLAGPWEKFSGNPIIHSAPGAGTPPSQLHYGPGHCSVVTVGGGGGSMAMVYAAEAPGGPGPRNLMLDPIVWTPEGWPVVKGRVPSNTTQSIPT